MNASEIGIMASRATALPTPIVNKDAAMNVEKIVATDWADVLSPNALPVIPSALSVIMDWTTGKIEALKKPIESAAAM